MFKKIVGLGFSSTGKNAKDVKKYIDSLVSSGADEFFTGYNPPYWHEKFGFEVSPNGRFAEHEQITSFETLKQLTEEIHSHNLELFINLNFWYYTDETFPLIQKMLDEFQEIGIDGVICGNIGILEYLKKINYSGKINISTISALYNKEAIRFFLENYRINKIILSREITLKEIEDIVNAFPETKFEVFGEGDFCRYNNGLCFAEHKYSNKDICTVVVNDLVVKKKFRPDFKKIILDENLSNEEKINLLNDEYKDVFERIEEIFVEIPLSPTLSPQGRKGENLSTLVEGEACESKQGEFLKEELKKIIEISKNRVDLYFDAMKPVNSRHNKNILVYLKALKYLDLEEYADLQAELENSIKSGMKYLAEKTKEVGGFGKLKAEELAKFYGRSDNLNLYSYLFFSKLQNLETVKFPTRGRNYNEKIKVIEEVLAEGKVPKKYLDRGISLERTHYDLTYLFGEKLWFRDLMREFS